MKLAAAILALYLSASALAAQAGQVDSTVYTTVAVPLREEPNARARIVARLPADTRVRMAGCAKGWCEVGFNGLSGYLRRRSLTAKRAPPSLHF